MVELWLSKGATQEEADRLVEEDHHQVEADHQEVDCHTNLQSTDERLCLPQ